MKSTQALDKTLKLLYNIGIKAIKRYLLHFARVAAIHSSLWFELRQCEKTNIL